VQPAITTVWQNTTRRWRSSFVKNKALPCLRRYGARWALQDSCRAERRPYRGYCHSQGLRAVERCDRQQGHQALLGKTIEWREHILFGHISIWDVDIVIRLLHLQEFIGDDKVPLKRAESSRKSIRPFGTILVMEIGREDAAGNPPIAVVKHAQWVSYSLCSSRNGPHKNH
jgi:hypothetical protein